MSWVAVPEGFELRSPTIEDADAIAELINEVTLAEAGVPWTTVAEVRDELSSPDRERSLPEVLLIASDGVPAGYLQFWASEPPEVPAQVFVRPALSGSGLNAFLVRHAEAIVADRLARTAPVRMRLSRFAGNEAAAGLFASLGYAYVRTFWMMQIDLEGDPAPEPARIPAGIEIRAFEPGRDEVGVHAAFAEAFADHWGSPFDTLERWRHRAIEGEGSLFDPSLWFLAVEGDEIAGAATCTASTPRDEHTAEVGYLAVRRAWRRRGVGLALLLSAFAEFRRRGIPRCELGVDAENPTGATRLYERAGMHAAYSWEVWERELRTGSGAAPS